MPKMSVGPRVSATEGSAGGAAGAPAAGAGPPPMAATGRFSGGGGPPAFPVAAPPGALGGSLVTGALGWPPQPLTKRSNPANANTVPICLTTVCFISLSSASLAGKPLLATGRFAAGGSRTWSVLRSTNEAQAERFSAIETNQQASRSQRILHFKSQLTAMPAAFPGFCTDSRQPNSLGGQGFKKIEPAAGAIARAQSWSPLRPESESESPRSSRIFRTRSGGARPDRALFQLELHPDGGFQFQFAAQSAAVRRVHHLCHGYLAVRN